MKKLLRDSVSIALISTLFLQYGIAAHGVTLSPQQVTSIKSSTKGKIVLQVESKGEAWYITPDSSERLFLGRPGDAYEVMRSKGVGITKQDLDRIPFAFANYATGLDSDGDGLSNMFEEAIRTNSQVIDSDADGFNDFTEVSQGYNPQGPGSAEFDTAFAQRHAGKIFIDVQTNGQAWYVNPNDNKRYFLGRPDDAFEVMRSTGLGISNDNIQALPVASDSKDPNEQRPTQKTPKVDVSNQYEELRAEIESENIYTEPAFLDCGDVVITDDFINELDESGDLNQATEEHYSRIFECVAERAEACLPTSLDVEFRTETLFHDFIELFAGFRPSFPIEFDYVIHYESLGKTNGLCNYSFQLEEARAYVLDTIIDHSNTEMSCAIPDIDTALEAVEAEDTDSYCSGTAIDAFEQDEKRVDDLVERVWEQLEDEYYTAYPDQRPIDTDEDGILDRYEEQIYDTDPQDADTDDDGLTDGEEIYEYGTDPLDKDSDDDLFNDGDEVEAGNDPLENL